MIWEYCHISGTSQSGIRTVSGNKVSLLSSKLLSVLLTTFWPGWSPDWMLGGVPAISSEFLNNRIISMIIITNY